MNLIKLQDLTTNLQEIQRTEGYAELDKRNAISTTPALGKQKNDPASSTNKLQGVKKKIRDGWGTYRLRNLKDKTKANQKYVHILWNRQC